MDVYEVTTPPATTPVTLDEAKTFLRTYSDIGALEDALITSMIETAVKSGEDQFTNRCFITRTITATFDRLEYDNYRGLYFIKIYRAPNVSITSVEAKQSGSFVDITSDTELMPVSNGFPKLYFTTTPTFDSTALYPFQVVFTAGYGAASAVPDGLKVATLQHVNFLYENRGDAISQISPLGEVTVPFQILSLYTPYRIQEVFAV